MSCTVGQRELTTVSKLSIRFLVLRFSHGVFGSMRRVKSIHRRLAHSSGVVGKFNLTVDLAVHTPTLWYRRVVVNDDLRPGIETLDLANELQGFASIALRIAGISHHKRKFRNNAEVSHPAGDLQRLLRGDALLHLLQRPVRSRFRAEEDHGASAAAQRGQSRVRVSRHHIHACLAPPAEAQWCEPFCQIARVVFPQEEVHVIELNRVGAVLRSKMAAGLPPFALGSRIAPASRRPRALRKNCSGRDSRCWHGEPRFVCPKNDGRKIFLRRARVKRHPGKAVRPLHHALRIVDVPTRGILIRQACNRLRIRVNRVTRPAIRAACLHPDRERRSRRTRHSESHPHRLRESSRPRRSEHAAATVVISRLVSMAAAICGPGMQVTPSISTRCWSISLRMRSRGIVIDIAVDDGVLLPTFQHGCQGEHRQRQATIARPGCTGIEEDDHLATSAT